jgi:hypothetical protein
MNFDYKTECGGADFWRYFQVVFLPDLNYLCWCAGTSSAFQSILRYSSSYRGGISIMRKAGLLRLLLFSLLSTTTLRGENYLLKGTQTSRIKYSLTQRIVPIAGTKSLIISTVAPSPFQSPTYNQEIENLAINFSPEPTKHKKKIDKHGNKIIVVT